jgi:hypothetical protein
MKRRAWIGWLVAATLFAGNVSIGRADQAPANPLEGRLLQTGGGAFFVYHQGTKYALQTVDLGDRVLDAIPTASATQWDALFASGGSPEFRPIVPAPQAVPGYS